MLSLLIYVGATIGGFILARGLERSGLHRRIALGVLRTGGTRPANLVGGFMIATFALAGPIFGSS